ncbi:hypothetical protein FRC08_015586 [Ceratobasidium sp. 394]|nr:hypothetical protein FRC08_015586 [Ceratobasidium sp. 394]
MIFAAGFVIAAAVAGSSAQSLGSVSAACQNAGAAVLAGPAGTCLGASALLNVALTPANQSLIPPIDKWLASVRLPFRSLSLAHP